MSQRNKDNSGQGSEGFLDFQSRPTVTVTELRKALQERADELPERFSLPEVRKTIEIQAAEYKNARSKTNAKLRTVLDSLYDEFLYLSTSQIEQDRFLQKCADEGVPIEVGNDLSVVLVRFHLGRSEKATNRSASVLREAALQGIAPGFLADTLGEEGSGINAMARQFAKRSVVKQDNGQEVAKNDARQ